MPDFHSPAMPGRDGFEDDPDLANIGADSDESSDLGDLAAELTAELATTTLLKVPARPGWTLRCRTDFTFADMNALRKTSRNKMFAGGLDSTKFNALLIGSQCEAIIKDGDPATLAEFLGVDGPVTFATKEFQALYQVRSVAEAVVAMFGREADVSAASSTLLDEAGWGGEGETADPTE